MLPTIDENIVEENNPSIQSNEQPNNSAKKKTTTLLDLTFTIPNNSTASLEKTIIAADD